jgi:hypothetical protein
VTVTVVPGVGLPAFQNRSVTTPITEGRQATVSGAIVDPAPQGDFVLRVNWGDGSHTQTYRFVPGTLTAAVSHHYHEAGIYTIHLSWGDDRGTSNTADLTATVLPAQEDPSSTVGLKDVASASRPTLALTIDPHSEAFSASGTYVFTQLTDTHSEGTVSGQASPLGAFTGTFSQDGADHLRGTATFQFADGDLSIRYDVRLDPATDHFLGTWHVTDGTGLLTHVHGGGQIDITGSDSAGPFVLSGGLAGLPIGVPLGHVA